MDMETIEKKLPVVANFSYETKAQDIYTWRFHRGATFMMRKDSVKEFTDKELWAHNG